MKLVMDEKLKHRLIGLAVIISIGAIFAPAIMKKSSEQLDSNFSVNIPLPNKPGAPTVVMVDDKEMFKTIKVAKVNIPPVSAGNQLPQLAKAEPISSSNSTQVAANSNLNNKPIQKALNEAAKTTAKGTVTVAEVKLAANKALLAKNTNVAPKNTQVIAKRAAEPLGTKPVYAVQLASFSQLSNAQNLVNKLHAQGYKASLSKSAGRKGAIYKVYAGHSPNKNDVLKLKTQLASAMQLHGFVVNTGVN